MHNNYATCNLTQPIAERARANLMTGQKVRHLRSAHNTLTRHPPQDMCTCYAGYAHGMKCNRGFEQVCAVRKFHHSLFLCGLHWATRQAADRNTRLCDTTAHGFSPEISILLCGVLYASIDFLHFCTCHNKYACRKPCAVPVEMVQSTAGLRLVSRKLSLDRCGRYGIASGKFS